MSRIEFPISEVLSFMPTSTQNRSYGDQVYHYFNLERFKGTALEAQCEKLRVSSELAVRNFVANNLAIDTFRIPESQFKRFRKQHGAMRWGQELYNYLALYKITDPKSKILCERLYHADKDTARALVELVLDREN